MRVASEPPTEPHGRSYLETLATKEDLPHTGPDPMHTAEVKQGHHLRVGAADTDLGLTAQGALRTHALWIAETNNIQLSENDVAEIDAIASEHLSTFETEQEKREAFRVIENHMPNRYDLEIDAEAAKDSRRRAREGAGASRLTMSDLESESNTGLSDGAEAPYDEYFLDSKVVAVYW